MVHANHFAKAKATRYKPFFKVFVYLDKLPQQQLPTDQLPKHTLIYKKSFVRPKATSYHLIFKASLYLDQWLEQATSYQPVLKAHIDFQEEIKD
jgi:hypothetical protein